MLKDAFLKSSKRKEHLLYHCVPVSVEGDCIRVSENYGYEVPSDTLKQLGSLEKHPPLVFASPYISKAMAFGLQGNLQEKLMNLPSAQKI